MKNRNMLQYKIPQNVGLEDKIVGPFSLRQLIIVCVGTGVSYVLYLIMVGIYELNILEYLVIGLPALVSFAAALIRINNISFTKYVMLMIEFAIKPKKRMWDHHGIAHLVNPDLSETISKKKEDENTGANQKQNVNLSDLSRILDSGGFDHVETVSHEDIDEVSDDNLMIQAFFGKEPNMYWRTAKSKVDYKRRLKLLSELPKTEVQAMKDLKQQITHLKQGDSVKRETTKQEPIIIEPKTAVQERPKTQTPKVEVKKSAPLVASSPTPTAAKITPPVIPVPKKIEVVPPVPKSETTPDGEKKKRRRRRRKGKNPGPVRDAQINNTIAKTPVQLIENPPKRAPEIKPQNIAHPSPKQEPKKAESKVETPAPPKSGEIRFEELKKGDIEWGL
jgi:hypothetical protein